MNQNGIQEPKTLEEQLDILKQEQVEAEKIYRGRMQMGALSHDSASVQELAQTILERKMKIEDLESQIVKETEELGKEQKFSTDKDRKDSKALTVYNGKNPVLKWIQKMVNKLEEKMQKLDKIKKMGPLDRNKEMFEKEMKHVNEMQYNEYDIVANMKIPERQETKVKNAHQRFIDQISGNGAYHTFGPNAKNLESSITMEDKEKLQNVENKIQENNDEIIGR